MKQIGTLILTYLISTTLVLAQHTNASVQSDINQVLNQINNVTEYQSIQKSQNTCESSDVKRLVKKIDKRIAKARKSNETLESSIATEVKKFKKLKYRQNKMSKRILKRKRRIKRAHRKMKKSFPKLTRSEYVKKLKASMSRSHIESGVADITNLLTVAGSMENYLLDMKHKIETCEEVLDGGNSGLIYLIIFIGVPVLAILASLITLIFGATTWALWLFIGAISLLLVFFVLGNLGKSLILNDEEV